MAAGGAQFWCQQFVDTAGVPYGGVKVYHYAAATTSDKDVWIDEGRSTVAPQPVRGDSAGMVCFYGDGEYRLRVETAAGILLYDWDHIRISKDEATMWEGNRGTAYPAAAAINKGHLYALLDGSDQIEELGINDDATGFHRVPASLKNVAYAALPAVATAHEGWLRHVTNRTRGLWMQTDTQWVSVPGETVNVKEFGAKGDGSTNDTVKIQDAIDAINDIGGGIVFFPPGTYIVTQVTIGSDTWLRGAGAGASILKNTSTSLTKGIVTNKDQAAGNSNLLVSDLTLERTVALTGSSGNFNECIYFKSCTQVRIERCRIIGVASASWSDKGIHCESCGRVWIVDNYVYKIGDNPIGINNAGGGVVRAVIANNMIEWAGAHIGSGIVCTGSQVLIIGNHGTQPTATNTPHNLIETGEGAADIIIADNHAENMGLLITLSGSRLLITNNRVRGLSSGVTLNCSGNQGNIADIILTGNQFRGGASISLTAGTVSTFIGALIADNMCLGGSSINTAAVQRGIITRNYVLNAKNAGITVSTGNDSVIQGNLVIGAGANPTIAQASDEAGINVQGACVSATKAGLVQGNTCISCKGFGLFFESPQFWNVIDNNGWNNTGTSVPSGATLRVTDNSLLSVNMTLNGAVPFQIVQHRGPGRPWLDIGFHASPGSIYYRTDGTPQMYFKQTGTAAAGWRQVTTEVEV